MLIMFSCFAFQSMARPKTVPRRADAVISGYAIVFPLVICLVVSSGFCWSAEGTTNWPQFGGPRRDFTLTRNEVHADLLSWPPSGPRELWQRELGDGYSSVVFAHGKLVTMFCKGGRETIIALDPDSGRDLWTHSYACPFESWEYGSGAFSTPTIVGDRVYCVGIMAMLHCLDLETGQVLWKHDLLREFGGRIPGHGYGCSPIAVGDQIILSVGGPADHYTMEPVAEESGDSVFAFDLQTGAVVWSTLNHRIRHASPILIECRRRAAACLTPLRTHRGIESTDRSGTLGRGHPWTHECVGNTGLASRAEALNQRKFLWSGQRNSCNSATTRGHADNCHTSVGQRTGGELARIDGAPASGTDCLGRWWPSFLDSG